MVKHICVLTAVFVLIFSVVVEAKILYVDQATGNDSVSYETNSASNPWRTIGRAAWGSTNRGNPNSSQAARAGDTVIVREGTYNALAASGERHIPAYNPINSGSQGYPITFRAEGNVYLHSTSGNGPVIGASMGKHYIIWDGFIIDEQYINTISDTGPVGIWWSDGCQIINCTIKGYPRWANDNHNGIRVERTRNSVIRNNRLYNVYNTGNCEINVTGIMTYDSEDLLIENNEISNTCVGIYLKGSRDMVPLNRRQTVRYNLIYNITFTGIRFHAVMDSDVYQNIIRTAGQAVSIIALSSNKPSNIRFGNNTIYGCAEGLYIGLGSANPGHKIFNNIFYVSGYLVNAEPSTLENIANKNVITFEHNTYYGYSNYSKIYSANYSFNSWKTATGHDVESPASLSIDPQFVNVSRSDFRILQNSPCINAGIDILDLNRNGSTTDRITVGAYITGNEIIGRTSGNSSPSSTLAPPTGLRIQ